MSEHSEVQELVGAYVLNAVSDIEKRRVERHLSSCEECAREVRMLGETATELAWLPAAEDADELVERITTSLPWRPQRVYLRAAGAVAAVAMVVAGVLGVALIRENGRNDQLGEILAAADVSTRLQPQAGFTGSGQLYVSEDGAALILTDMPDPGREQAYQLWAISGDEPTSMTVVEGADVVEIIDWEGRADTFAITIERAGGSPVPTSDPVLVGSVA